MSLFKVTLKSLPKVTLYTHSSVTPTSHSQKSLSEVTLKSHSQKSLSKFTPKSFSKVTLRSHSQKSLSKVTLRSHSQKPLPSHSQKSLQRSLQRSLPPTHTQPYLLPYAADRLKHFLGGHPGLPIHQDTSSPLPSGSGRSGRGWLGRSSWWGRRGWRGRRGWWRRRRGGEVDDPSITSYLSGSQSFTDPNTG